jgi:glyoxylase-like metal-dependent hydrolase (beta-lactamase superfamily II)
LIQEWATSNLKNSLILLTLGIPFFDKSLAKYGFSRDDYRCFMTHLHFDHCGGSVQWNKNKTGYEPFSKRKILTNGPLGMGYKTKSQEKAEAAHEKRTHRQLSSR